MHALGSKRERGNSERLTIRSAEHMEIDLCFYFSNSSAIANDVVEVTLIPKRNARRLGYSDREISRDSVYRSSPDSPPNECTGGTFEIQDQGEKR